MKKLYCLLAIFLVCGLSGVAKADTDFHMVVLDPYNGPYLTTPIYDLSTFAVSFTACSEPSQTPTDSGYDGCFTFKNQTGFLLDSLTITVNALVDGQTAGCAPSGLLDGDGNALDIFSNPSCSTLSSSYTLTFTGGLIELGELVTIAESGVDPKDFPATNATPTALNPTTTAVTPEPSSILLLSTGTVALGSFFNKRRRRTDTADRS